MEDDLNKENLVSDSSLKTKEYWWSRSPEERFVEIERLRRIKYGYNPNERMKKVLEVVDLETNQIILKIDDEQF